MKKNRTSPATIVKRSFKTFALILFIVSTFVLAHLGYACGVFGNKMWRATDPAFMDRFMSFTNEPGVIFPAYAVSGLMSVVLVAIICGAIVGFDQNRFPTMHEWKKQRELPAWDD